MHDVVFEGAVLDAATAGAAGGADPGVVAGTGDPWRWQDGRFSMRGLAGGLGLLLSGRRRGGTNRFHRSR